MTNEGPGDTDAQAESDQKQLDELETMKAELKTTQDDRTH